MVIWCAWPRPRSGDIICWWLCPWCCLDGWMVTVEVPGKLARGAHPVVDWQGRGQDWDRKRQGEWLEDTRAVAGRH